MNILLIGNKTLHKLKLPSKVEGSFFLTDPTDNENLLNFDADNDSWIINTNEQTKIKDLNNNPIPRVRLKNNDYWFIEYKNKKNIIYCSEPYDNSTKIYEAKSDFELIIGKDASCNLKYDNPFIQAKHASLKYTNGKWLLNVTANACVYVNDGLVITEQTNLNNGDFIFLFGLKILVMNNLIIINNPENKVALNEPALVGYQLSLVDVTPNEEVIDTEEIKEEELYKDNDYFFKTPRLRRFVETYELNVANPPAKQDQEEMPLLLTIGPMITMALISVMTAVNTFSRIINGETTFDKAWMSLLTPVLMLTTSLLWPNVTRSYQKKRKKKKEKIRQEKYREYIADKKKLIESEAINQTAIMKENLLSLDDCYKIIVEKDRTLWERKISQKDFLTVRVGIGDRPIDMDVKFNEEDFSIEKDILKDEASSMIEEAKMLHSVPISYSFFDKKATAIMGNIAKGRTFIDNVLLQLITFHSYDELKIVIFTTEENKSYWEVYKDLPHMFSNDKEVRFFATTPEERKNLSSYLEEEFVNRIVNTKDAEVVENEIEKETFSPFYLILTDDYVKIRKLGICEKVFDVKEDIGFGFAILETRLSHLPSKCIDFITIDEANCGILHNDVDDYSQQSFQNELNNSINMRKCVETLSNIPIEFEEDLRYLPTSLSFLEMYNVGKVEQLNIMNRWKLNDPTKSLRAPIGVNDQNNIIFLDLHEKYHGPHGLIAGTTGSGKSEFIITYILSMAINFNPNEVAFILIDYKGGGLAGAFENKKNNIRLPHLAGTITNLDKNELNRTLVSIQSELKRRQSVFNAARDELGESTIDIYKYQKFFREGRLSEPMPHLFIICDEFAELKQQQPEFMDNLISAARIGRSLGVHLILATQKPSGVVNDQIWSNTKFRVCLKVAEKGDSNEIIKCPDAAEIKNAGRFYLQVGLNEIFVLGQSGWCGAPYVPSDIVKKEYDRSVSVIDNIGNVIKSISGESNKKKIVAEGDELTNILKYTSNLAKKENLKAMNLWLESLALDMGLEYVIDKYNFSSNEICAVLGEYDDPTNQYQNILTLPLNEEGNTMIYGLSGTNREMLIRTLIYSVSSLSSSSDVNFYILDFGSESFKIFSKLPHVGDVVLSQETEKVDKLLSMINDEITERKKLLADYNGVFSNYNKNSGQKLPLITVIINNLDAFKEMYPSYDELLLKLTREGKRLGIIFIIATSSQSGLYSRFLKNFDHEFVLDMNSKEEYMDILGRIGNVYPADNPGRGLFKGENVYEFQTAKICDDEVMVEFIKNKAEEFSKTNTLKAKPVPVLPEVIEFNSLSSEMNDMKALPIGLMKESLRLCSYNFKQDKATIISANETISCKNFVYNLLKSFKKLNTVVSVLIDPEEIFSDLKEQAGSYCTKDFDTFVDQIITFINDKIVGTPYNIMFVVAGVEKFKDLISSSKLDELMKKIKEVDNANIILLDNSFKLKKLIFEPWYNDLVVNTNGIWIGSGAMDQGVIKAADYNKAYGVQISNDFAWIFKNGKGVLIKTIGGDFKDEE